MRFLVPMGKTAVPSPGKYLRQCLSGYFFIAPFIISLVLLWIQL